ncbi:hypothetical protein A0H81_10927 [Grifola frondosa]|uniref:Uncharacterized protein n=1 Tax=Grifola frondosa TaxID=5627 RepID=A0A1C7LX77_GRIFR|nr:hypothetical protein A0H81_10927 [Grifola frondosa]
MARRNNTMVQKKWNKDAPIVLEDHLVHIRDLVDDAFQQKYEAGWYHPANHALTFNAFRTSSKGGMLSVYPQAKLSLLGRQKRERRNVPEMAPAAEAEQDVGGKEPEEEQGAVPYEEKEEPSESRSAHHHHDRSSEPGDSGDRDDPKSQFPDFVVIEKFPSKRNFAVFVVEVKPPPPDFHTIHKESVKKVKVENIMKRAESQNVQQAQFAFAEFPMQTVVHIFCMVATYFRVLTFHRSELPEIGEYWPRTPKFSASEMSSHQMLAGPYIIPYP